VPTQAFARTYRESQPVLLTRTRPISGLQKTPNWLNGLLDWLEWIRTKSKTQEQNEDNLDMIGSEKQRKLVPDLNKKKFPSSYHIFLLY